MAQFFKTEEDYLSATKITKLEDDAYILAGKIMQANLQFAEVEHEYLTLKEQLTELKAKYYIDIRTQKENSGINLS